jgi:hypothetical protein
MASNVVSPSRIKLKIVNRLSSQDTHHTTSPVVKLNVVNQQSASKTHSTPEVIEIPLLRNSGSVETLAVSIQRIKINIQDEHHSIPSEAINSTSQVRWQEHPESPNYLINDDGRVYSKHSSREMFTTTESGYHRVRLIINRMPKLIYVHRLVAICFVNNPDPINLTVVNHKDHNKLNNNYRNLEWVTVQGNSAHALTRESYKPSYMRAVQQIDTSGQVINTFESATEASRYVSISREMIKHCCRGTRPRTFDSTGMEYTWRYVEETRVEEKPVDAKPIQNYPNYLITRDGRVYSLYKGTYISLWQDSKGYIVVTLYESGEKKNCFVHTLVTGAYLVSDPDRPWVNHIDSNRKNNLLENLEYVTQQENVIHAYEHGNNAKHKKSVKMIHPDTKEVLRIFSSASEASRIVNINYRQISACCLGRTQLAGGYIWQFEE